MKKIFSIVTAAAIAAAALPLTVPALATDEADLFSYEQSFEAYPSDDELTGSKEAGKWNLNGVSGIDSNKYLPLSSTDNGLYTARYYLDTASSSAYYTDNTTVEFSAEFKVDEDADNNGLIGFNFMADGSTQTELFFLSAKAEDTSAHVYLPKTGSFSRNEYKTENGYDAGEVGFGEWVKVTVKINNENVSYYVDDSYLTTVSFAGKTPLGNAVIDNLSIAARNAIKGGARNFNYRVYGNGKKLEYLPESDFSGSFGMNTTAGVSEGRLVFGNEDVLAADRTLASGDMLVSGSNSEYNAALNYNTREHIIKLNATVLDTAAQGDCFDVVSADGTSFTSARMRFVRLESNGDGTYKVLVNKTASNDSGAAPEETAAEGIDCGTPVNILIKITKGESSADTNVIAYYIDGISAGSVERTGGKVSYGRYIKLLAEGEGDSIASVDDVQAYCYANGVYPDFEVESQSRENGIVTITYTSELDLSTTEITGNSTAPVLSPNQKTITFKADETADVKVVAHSVAAAWTKTVSYILSTQDPDETEAPGATTQPAETDAQGDVTVPAADIFSYEQSFAVYPSDKDITADSEAGKWALGGFGVGDNDYLTVSNGSTAGGLNTASFYLDRNKTADYYTDSTTVEFGADFKVDSITDGTKGFIGFNLMNGTSTQTTFFLLGSYGDDAEPHLYIPVSKDFTHDSTASNGYDAGSAALGEWVNVTVKINKERISYYANGSYLTSVDFTGKTPLGNSNIDNIALAARNTVSGGVKNFSYKVYNNGKTADYLGYCDLAGGFRPNTTAVVSDGRLMFGNGDSVTADRTIASDDMSGSDYNAALAFTQREHIIKFNVTIAADAQAGDHLDLYNADGAGTARMRMVSLVKNADNTYNILVNNSLSNDNGAAPTLSPGAGYQNIACGTDVNVLVKLSPSESGADANVITYYINGREAASVDRTGGKVSYGRYMKLEASGGSDKIASVNNVQVYCYNADNKPSFDVAASERSGNTITISYTSEVDLGNTEINGEPAENVMLSADQKTVTFTVAADENVTVKAYTMAGNWTKTVSFTASGGDNSFKGTIENSDSAAADSPVVIEYTAAVNPEEIYLNGLQADAQVSEDGTTVTIAVPAGGFDTGIPYAVTAKSIKGETAVVTFTTEGPQRELTAYFTSVTADTIDGVYTISPALKVKNNLDAEQKVMVYSAEYSEGKLVGVDMNTVTVGANSETPFTVSCELNDSTDKAEIFVWTADMKPVLKNAFVINK